MTQFAVCGELVDSSDEEDVLKRVMLVIDSGVSDSSFASPLVFFRLLLL